MPYIADVGAAKARIGKLVGNGQCVTFVHDVIVIPPSSEWKRGGLVRGNLGIRPGTVIATFDADGHYGDHLDGTSHAAIYLGQDISGIQVLDQWTGHTLQPVHQRVIRFRNGVGLRVNDGDQFHVVE